MTELQEIEFGLLQQFLSICEQLNLTYYLVCGSALGAVKYGGFIPWDDDIDVALPRKDYEIFCRKAPQILPEWCFLQNLSFRTPILSPRKQITRQQNDLHRDDGGSPENQPWSVH